MDSLICFNLVDPSSAGSPTSNLFDGGWMCEYGVALGDVCLVGVGTFMAEKYVSK